MAEPLPARPEQSTPADLAAAMPVALVGYGYWGAKLHAALRARPAFQLRRLHVRSPHQLSPQAQVALEGVTITGSAAELWQDPEIEAVILATPISSHYSLCKAALLAGKHVFVEKPLALSHQEAGELASVARSRGLTLETDYTWTHSPGLLRAQRLVEEQWFGELRHVQIRFHQLGRFRSEDIGPLLGVHMLSILAMFTKLEGLRWTRRTVAGSASRASSVLLFGEDPDSGVTVLLDGSLDDPIRERSALLLGEDGSISFRPLAPGTTLEALRYSREPSSDDVVQRQIEMTLATSEDDNLGRALEAFCEVVRGSRPSNLEQSLTITAALEELFPGAGSPG